MRNCDRIAGLQEVKAQAAHYEAEISDLNQRMHAFVKDPGDPATRHARADRMVRQMADLLGERERILERLAALDPALTAEHN